MEYEVVIGLEVHVELKTNTKIYCGCANEFNGKQNTHCCPVCMGLPGALPVLNKKAIEYAIKAGIALNCTINKETYMARKNYFYPDCPKNYQITQDETPICSNGYVEIDNGLKKIEIQRIHIEEDAGKALHREDGSYMDFNRSGTPLIEIVSKPNMRCAKEAVKYLENLKAILQYIEISDCKMEEGSLRCDANVSIRPFGATNFGIKTEIKNMNSFKAVEKAIEFEVRRQRGILDIGESIKRETRRWDDSINETVLMRSKEQANDYRYFPEPDMVYILINDKWIHEIKKTIPELPQHKKSRYMRDYCLTEYEANILVQSKFIGEFFEECISKGGKIKDISNWIMGEVLRVLKDTQTDIRDVKFKAEDIVDLTKLIDNGIISSTIAKKIFKEMFEMGEKPAKIVEEKEMVQLSDEKAIVKIAKKVLDANKQSVLDFINGKSKAKSFLVGQIMKESKGKANPKIVNKILEQQLNSKLKEI